MQQKYRLWKLQKSGHSGVGERFGLLEGAEREEEVVVGRGRGGCSVWGSREAQRHRERERVSGCIYKDQTGASVTRIRSL